MTFPVPEAVLKQHTVILGKTRSGKSSTMRLLVERLLDNKKPVCIIDPKGDWWGIKSSADGKRAGYEVVIFGGKHADVPIDQHSGKVVAELVATGNRPALIDLGGWMVGERTRFFIDFASTLFQRTHGHRWLCIDECHNFAPQGKILDPDAGKMLHWANRLASEGAGKGVVLISASQRPQKVHKDYLTSHETLIAKRVIHPLDRGAMKDWIDGCGDPAKGKEVLDSLASLQRPQGWVWSPEIGFGPKLVTFPMFSTYDSFAVQTGDADRKLSGWASVDLDDVKSKLAAVVKEAAANDPKALKAEIAQLKQELFSKAAGAVAATMTVDLQAAEKRGFEQAQKKLWREAERHAEATISAAMDALDALISPISVRLKEQIGASRKQRVNLEAIEFSPSAPPARPAAARVVPAVTRAAKSNGAGDVGLAKGHRIVLTAIAQYPEGIDRERLTVITGYKKSSRDTYIQALAAAGHIGLAGTKLVATSEGMDALGDSFQPLPTGAGLRAYWLAKLSGGERNILEFLISKYPDDVERAEIDAACGYLKSSRDTYLQKLDARMIVDLSIRGRAKASDLLF